MAPCYEFWLHQSHIIAGVMTHDVGTHKSRLTTSRLTTSRFTIPRSQDEECRMNIGKSQRDAEGGCPDSFVSGKPPTTEEAKFELKDNP